MVFSEPRGIRPKSEFVERRRSPRLQLTPLGEDVGKPPALVPQYFSTESLPDDQQFAAWRAHLSPVLGVRLPDDVRAEDGFVAHQTIWNLRGILLVEQSAPAFSYERSRDQVRFSPIDHWQLTFLRFGQSWTAVDQRVAANRPGMVEICSLGQSFRGRATATKSVTLIVPVDQFAERGGLPAGSHHAVLGGHRAKLLIDFVTSIEDSLSRLSPEGLASVRSSLLEIVFDTVTFLVGPSNENDPVSHIGLMTRARRFIQSHLASEELTPDALCRELAISRTRLYELFESSGGVQKYIRERRLLAAHAMLADDLNTRKVVDVAMALGFDSAANFSRAFAQQFGYSPSSVRRHAARSETQADLVPAAGTAETYESILENLTRSP